MAGACVCARWGGAEMLQVTQGVRGLPVASSLPQQWTAALSLSVNLAFPPSTRGHTVRFPNMSSLGKQTEVKVNHSHKGKHNDNDNNAE